VQIHPIHAGHVNDHKVISEHEFDNFDEAKTFMEQYNEFLIDLTKQGNKMTIVYNVQIHPIYDEIAGWPFAIDTETGENPSDL
jgi:uncharacterized protein YabN with tetrapyrrole methylase and pyrophosphatase domain